jgi:hypothetical protein
MYKNKGFKISQSQIAYKELKLSYNSEIKVIVTEIQLFVGCCAMFSTSPTKNHNKIHLLKHLNMSMRHNRTLLSTEWK